MRQHCASMLCLIINHPSRRSMNIYMQSVPGSQVCASGGGVGRGVWLCVYTVKQSNTRRQRRFACNHEEGVAGASRAFLFVVAPCNLFKSHLDAAGQITGARRLTGSNPTAPLVSLHGKKKTRDRAPFFFLLKRRRRCSVFTAFAGISFGERRGQVKGQSVLPAAGKATDQKECSWPVPFNHGNFSLWEANCSTAGEI